tara:strand:- start:988 stop:1260 length:273 start_codon:yes stop_codon:yes gene_type:complete
MVDHLNYKSIPTPAGWIVSPRRDYALFFVREPQSVKSLPKITTELWYTKNGMPTRFKNTRIIDLESAIETWNELISNGWRLFEYEQRDAS